MSEEFNSPPKIPVGSAFRLFCNEKWYEHKDEIFAWTGKALVEYDSKYYFNKHRWLLKRMFKEHKESEDV
jgi:hypothetical protein